MFYTEDSVGEMVDQSIYVVTRSTDEPSRAEPRKTKWLGQGEPGAKLCHAHRHNRLDNSSE